MAKQRKQSKSQKAKSLRDLYIHGIRKTWDMNPVTKIVIPKTDKEKSKRVRVTRDEYDD